MLQPPCYSSHSRLCELRVEVGGGGVVNRVAGVIGQVSEAERLQGGSDQDQDQACVNPGGAAYGYSCPAARCRTFTARRSLASPPRWARACNPYPNHIHTLGWISFCFVDQHTHKHTLSLRYVFLVLFNVTHTYIRYIRYTNLVHIDVVQQLLRPGLNRWGAKPSDLERRSAGVAPFPRECIECTAGVWQRARRKIRR